MDDDILLSSQTLGWTPLMVARSWYRNWLEGILSKQPEGHIHTLPSPYLSLPLTSIFKIARECRWRNTDPLPTCDDTCAVCLERKCTVSAEGCGHEFYTRCALYLCSTSNGSTSAVGPPGSIPCPLRQHGIASFTKCPGTNPVKEMARTSFSLSLCTACPREGPEPCSISTPLCRPEFSCTGISPLASSSFRSLSCQRFPSMKLHSGLCMGGLDTNPSLATCMDDRQANNQLGRCFSSSLQRSASHSESGRSWSFFNQYVTPGNG